MTEYTNNNHLTYEQVLNLIHSLEFNNIKARIIPGGIEIYPVNEKEVRLMLELCLSRGITVIDSSGPWQNLEANLDMKIRQNNIEHLKNSFEKQSRRKFHR